MGEKEMLDVFKGHLGISRSAGSAARRSYARDPLDFLNSDQAACGSTRGTIREVLKDYQSGIFRLGHLLDLTLLAVFTFPLVFCTRQRPLVSVAKTFK